MLYHYTDRLTAADIIRDGVIRAQHITLHRDMLAQDAGLTIGPLVWLTTATVPEPSVVVKLIAAGWPRTLVGDIWRIAVDAPQAQELVEWSYDRQIAVDWWRWSLLTAQLAGAKIPDWRVMSTDITRADWRGVESLKIIDTRTGGCVWSPEQY